MAVDYGRDVACLIDLNPLLPDATGTDLMVQVCANRLFCRQGSCLSAPSEPTLDVRDFLNGDLDLSKQSATQQVSVLCQNAVLGDERVLTADIVSTYNIARKELTIRIQATGANGPFALTLVVSQVTVQLLRQT